MELVTLGMDVDLTITNLNEVLTKIYGRIGEELSVRMIVGSGYSHTDILEIIFGVRAKLDIPFERSYVLDRCAWMLLVDGRDNIIFYSPGA